MDHTDAALLVLRTVLGVVLVAHGANHLWGGGRIPGAARWFESLGLRHALLQAWLSALVELAAGAGLALGLLTPLVAAACVGLMLVAGVIAHRPNGFFIFREGYEYVLVLALGAVVVSVAGPGSASLNAVLGIDLAGWAGAAVSILLGGLGSALLLATSWRPVRTVTADTSSATGT